MGHYGHPHPKRHKAYTNNKWAEKYNKGKFNLKEFKKEQDESKKPTITYVDGSGKKRYKGSAFMKSSQKLRPLRALLLVLRGLQILWTSYREFPILSGSIQSDLDSRQ